jgi:hypothetical protein
VDSTHRLKPLGRVCGVAGRLPGVTLNLLRLFSCAFAFSLSCLFSFSGVQFADFSLGRSSNRHPPPRAFVSSVGFGNSSTRLFPPRLTGIVSFICRVCFVCFAR